jgi:GNAT superfamily N-acetyltransferase
MRQIGVNQYCGEHPGIIDGCLDYLAICEGTRKKQQELFEKKTPVRRFFHLAQKELSKPLLHGISTQHDFWRIGEHTLVELVENDYLSDVKNGRDFMLHIQSLFVVDTHRGEGHGFAVMKKLLDVAKRAGCILTLHARSFGIAPEGEELPYAVQSFDELWQRTSVDMWEVVELPDFEAEAVKFFYEKCGLQKFCGCREEHRKENISNNYFAYVPDSVSWKHRDALAHRLKTELCDLCS